MIKRLLIFSSLLFITNCTANPGMTFLGPVISGVKTGNIYQASISYGSGMAIKDIKKELKSKKQKISNKNKIFVNNIKNGLINPPIFLTYKIESVEISEILEPEPLP